MALKPELRVDKMAEKRSCLMTLFEGRADSQSLAQLNRLLDEGWRIAGVNPSPQQLPGVGHFKAFMVELTKPTREPK